jgi:MFS transporter, DHA1 family, inner membrane transport protein
MPTIGGALLWNILIMGSFTISAHHAWPAVLNVLLIGHGVALVPALQIRLMDVAEEAQTLAASLNHSAFNVANALGAWLGGTAISSGLGWTSTGWVGALLAVVGLSIFLVSAAGPRIRRRHRRRLSTTTPEVLTERFVGVTRGV